MSPLRALQHLADVLARTVRLLIAAVSRSVVGIRWLTRTALRVRVQGSGGVTGVARLYDLHAVVVAADLSLLAGLVWAVNAPTTGYLTLAVALGVLLAVPAALLVARAPGNGRAVIGLILVVRGVATVLAAQWLTSARLLLVGLVVLILPQWAVHLTLLRRLLPTGTPVFRTLWRANQYAVIAGLVAGVSGLVIGAFVGGWPLWAAALLLTVGALLAVRLPAAVQAAHAQGGGPDPAGPSAPPPPVKRLPQQEQRTIPEGLYVYRPSSLDPHGDEGKKK